MSGGRRERCARCARASPQPPSSGSEHSWRDVLTVGVLLASQVLHVLSISVYLMFGTLARMPRRHQRPQMHFGHKKGCSVAAGAPGNSGRPQVWLKWVAYLGKRRQAQSK